MNVKGLIAGMVAGMTALFVMAAGATAQDRMGLPTDKGYWLQEAASEQAQKISDFNELLFWIILVITIFVFALMFYTMFRFREKANPVPSKVSHNTFIEIVWTVVPIIILVVIGVISLPLLYWQDQVPETDMAIKVTGNQWNWTYSYPDHGDFEVTANVITDETRADVSELAAAEAELSTFLGWPAKMDARLLDTDYRLVLPVNTKVKVQLTASDVIHAWTVPAFGVKLDAVPGRLNETWFEVNQTGLFYGQCSELCGKDHGFMPIAVEVVSKETFARWVALQGGTVAAASAPTLGR